MRSPIGSRWTMQLPVLKDQVVHNHRLHGCIPVGTNHLRWCHAESNYQMSFVATRGWVVGSRHQNLRFKAKELGKHAIMKPPNIPEYGKINIQTSSFGQSNLRQVRCSLVMQRTTSISGERTAWFLPYLKFSMLGNLTAYWYSLNIPNLKINKKVFFSI